MKKVFFLMSALLVAAVACNKEPQGGNASTEEGQVYMSFKISAPATKSSTDAEGESNSNANPDVEVGFDKENKISTVDIFLQKDGEDVAVFANDVTAIIGAGTIYSATFDLKSFTDGDYHVYVVCNDSGNTVSSLDDEYTVANEDLTKNIAKDDYFLMTNAKLSDVVTIDADQMKAHTVATNPFNLGTVEVERAAARFDYREAKADNVYNIDENGAAGAGVQLTHVALINASKKFFYFRRVSADGTSNDWTVCGTETSTNYVVDTDWSLKKDAKTSPEPAKVGFFDYMDTPADWDWTELSTLNADDNISGTINNVPGDYKVWRYAVENTIPADGDNQVNGVTTGVVFKGILVDNTAAPITGTEAVYVHNNVYYGTWDKVEAAAKFANAPATLVAAVAYVNANSAVTTKYTDAGFSVYNPNAAGQYELLYYYWNRHNDNGDANVKGPMEFAVVRNNVYKLAVTKINKFGYPEDGETPDEPDPTDPDEELNYYFTVSVKVLPWVVRVNDIEF